MTGEDKTRANPVLAGLACRCPACGEGPLFSGYLSISENCSACGLDFAKVDTGDGPAFFVILVVGFLVVAGALVLEIAVTPPLWVHMALWLPLTLALSLALLRPFKGALVGLQYMNDAGQGRLEE